MTALLSPAAVPSLPVCPSSLRRATLAKRVASARSVVDEGWAGEKIFVGADPRATLAEVDALRAAFPGTGG